jgi:hypothetical protein
MILLFVRSGELHAKWTNPSGKNWTQASVKFREPFTSSEVNPLGKNLMHASVNLGEMSTSNEVNPLGNKEKLSSPMGPSIRKCFRL